MAPLDSGASVTPDLLCSPRNCWSCFGRWPQAAPANHFLPPSGVKWESGCCLETPGPQITGAVAWAMGPAGWERRNIPPSIGLGMIGCPSVPEIHSRIPSRISVPRTSRRSAANGPAHRASSALAPWAPRDSPRQQATATLGAGPPCSEGAPGAIVPPTGLILRPRSTCRLRVASGGVWKLDTGPPRRHRSRSGRGPWPSARLPHNCTPRTHSRPVHRAVSACPLGVVGGDL